MQVTYDMNQVLSRFNKLGGANNDLNLQDNFQDNTYVHPALVPLMKGDWLVSPGQAERQYSSKTHPKAACCCLAFAHRLHSAPFGREDARRRHRGLRSCSSAIATEAGGCLAARRPEHCMVETPATMALHRGFNPTWL